LSSFATRSLYLVVLICDRVNLLPAMAVGAPGPPNVAWKAGTSVNLEWTAPESTGGLPVVGYAIFYGLADANPDLRIRVDVDGASTSLTLSELDPQTSYVFIVAAKTEAGIGAFSVPSDPIQTNNGKAIHYSISRLLLILFIYLFVYFFVC